MNIDPLQTALQSLPHGPEFRFVDRIVSLVPGKEAVGEYTVRGDEPFLRGHFPDNPMMPGVILVEAVTQLAGVVAQSDPAIPPLSGLKLTALRNVKIFGTAKLGQTIHLRARVTGRLGTLIQAQGEASVSNTVIVTADVTLTGTNSAQV